MSKTSTHYEGLSSTDLSQINTFIDSVEQYATKHYPPEVAKDIVKGERMAIFDDIDFSDTLGKEPDIQLILERRRELLDEHFMKYDESEIVYKIPPFLKLVKMVLLGIVHILETIGRVVLSLFGRREKAQANQAPTSSEGSQEDLNESKSEGTQPIGSSSENGTAHVSTSEPERIQRTKLAQPKTQQKKLPNSHNSGEFDYSKFFANLDESGKFIMKINLKEYRKLTSFWRRLLSLKLLILLVLMGSTLIFLMESPNWTSTGWYLLTSKSLLGRITTKHDFYWTSARIIFWVSMALFVFIIILKLDNFGYWRKSRGLVELWNMYAIPVNYSQIMYELPGIKVEQTLKYFSELVYKNIISLQMVEVRA